MIAVVDQGLSCGLGIELLPVMIRERPCHYSNPRLMAMLGGQLACWCSTSARACSSHRRAGWAIAKALETERNITRRK